MTTTHDAHVLEVLSSITPKKLGSACDPSFYAIWTARRYPQLMTAAEEGDEKAIRDLREILIAGSHGLFGEALRIARPHDDQAKTDERAIRLALGEMGQNGERLGEAEKNRLASPHTLDEEKETGIRYQLAEILARHRPDIAGRQAPTASTARWPTCGHPSAPRQQAG